MEEKFSAGGLQFILTDKPKISVVAGPGVEGVAALRIVTSLE